MNLENIVLHEKSQEHKLPHIVGFHLCELSRIGKSMEIESRLSNCQGLGSGELGVNANEDGVFFSG